MKAKSQKRAQLLIVIPLLLLLSSCVEVKGDLGINSAARLTGELIYKIDKSFASAVGISSLDDINKEADKSISEQTGLCKDEVFTEDTTSYVLKCVLKNELYDSGDITAQVIGQSIVFRYRGNMDDSSNDANRADFGSVSITLRFMDPVVSYKENKSGLVQKVNDSTYRISGYATEPLDIEIIANCGSRCGVANSVPTPGSSQSSNPLEAAQKAVDAAKAATEAANKATAAANKAAEEAQAKADAEQIISEAKTAAAKILEDAKTKAENSSTNKKISILCIKGKVTKKVKAINPKCPKGFKKK